jgi:transposase
MNDKFRITPAQRQSLKRRLRSTRDKWEYRRILAILTADREGSISRAAQIIQVSRQSLYKWTNPLRTGASIRELRTRPRSGRPSLWTQRSLRVLKNSFKHPPDHWGYRGTTWTVSFLQDRLKRKGRLTIGEEALRRKLHEINRSWKRTRHQLKRDPQRAKKSEKYAGE